MKLLVKSIILLGLFFSGYYSVSAQRADKYSKYPAEDFEAYKNVLYVKDSDMQRLAVNAMSYYPKGYPLLVELISTNAASYASYSAAVTLTNFSQVSSYEADLKKLLKAVDKQAGAKTEASALYDQVRGAILRNLFYYSPKKYADEMVEAMHNHLQRSGRNISFADTWADDLNKLASVIDKKKLYIMVPLLVDNMEGFFPDTKERAHKALVLITGKDYPYDRQSLQSVREAMEKYRELYYTKLKPQIDK